MRENVIKELICKFQILRIPYYMALDAATNGHIEIASKEIKFRALAKSFFEQFVQSTITSDLILEILEKIESYLMEHEDLEDHEIIKEYFFASLVDGIRKLDLNDPMFSKARLFMTNLGPFSEQYVEEICPGLKEKFK